MRILFLIILILTLFSCTTETPDVSGYHVAFTHNGIEYEYETGLENIVTHVSGTGIMDNAINFYEGDSLHLTVVSSIDLLGASTAGQVRALFESNTEFTLNPEAPAGTIYFAPFFHFSDNGGYLDLDGSEFIVASVERISSTYESAGQQCFDVTIDFDYVFADAGIPGCGNGISCFNFFENGTMKTQICL